MSVLSEISVVFLPLAINITVVGAVLASSVVAAFRLAGTAHPRIRYVIAATAFFLSILLPIWMTFGFKEEQKTPIVAASENLASESPKEKFSASMPPQTESPIEEVPQTAPVLTENSEHYFPKLVITKWLSIGLLSLWAAVSILLLGREFAGYARLANRRRKWRRAEFETLKEIELPADARLYLSETDGPFAFGIFRQAIVFPAGMLTDLLRESLKSIARHELNHVYWHDPLVNAVLRLTRAIFWFSPPLWYLERVARLEREAAADFASIVSRKDLSDFKAAAADYTMTLMSVAQWSTNSNKKKDFNFAATEVGNQTSFENRVRRLLKSSEKSFRLRLAFAALILSAGIFGTSFLPVAAQSFPIAFDEGGMNMNDEFASPIKNEPAQFKNSDFNLRNNASKTPSDDVEFVSQIPGQRNNVNKTPSDNHVPINQTQKSPERQNNSNSSDERAARMCALGKTRDAAIMPTLIRDLGNDERVSKSSDCWNTGDWTPLLRTFKQPSPGEEAALALASMGEIALEPLVVALNDFNPSVRRNAAWAIGEIRNGVNFNRAIALEPLIHLLKHDDDAWVRRAAVFALGELKDRRSSEVLISSLKDENPRVREMAANALGEMKESSAIYALENRLKDGDKRVESMARWAIAEIQDR